MKAKLRLIEKWSQAAGLLPYARGRKKRGMKYGEGMCGVARKDVEKRLVLTNSFNILVLLRLPRLLEPLIGVAGVGTK